MPGPNHAVALASHEYFEWIAALLQRLLVKQGVPDDDIPQRPAEPVIPVADPEHDSDLDELRRILNDNPALRQAIKTNDI